jgi:hypothetical protein
MKEVIITKNINEESIPLLCMQDEDNNIGLLYVNEDDEERLGSPWQYFDYEEIENKVFFNFIDFETGETRRNK